MATNSTEFLRYLIDFIDSKKAEESAEEQSSPTIIINIEKNDDNEDIDLEDDNCKNRKTQRYK